MAPNDGIVYCLSTIYVLEEFKQLAIHWPIHYVTVLSFGQTYWNTFDQKTIWSARLKKWDETSMSLHNFDYISYYSIPTDKRKYFNNAPWRGFHRLDREVYKLYWSSTKGGRMTNKNIVPVQLRWMWGKNQSQNKAVTTNDVQDVNSNLKRQVLPGASWF